MKILAYRQGGRAIFLFGFAKNERGNIGDEELAEWRRAGRQLLDPDDAMIATSLAIGELMEVDYDNGDPKPSKATRQPLHAS